MKGLLFSPVAARLKALIGPLIANDATGALIGRLFANRIPHRGLTIDTSHARIAPSIKAALFWRGYESGEYRFIDKYLRGDRDVIELGGSIGVISCAIAKRLDRERRHVVVEADPELADVLERNLQINGCGHRTAVERVAISYSGAASVSFARGPTSVSGALADGRSDDIFSVPATTLAALVAAHGIDRYTLVCDIEGVEWDIFAHDRAALTQADMLIIEMHDSGDVTGIDAQLARVRDAGPFRLIDRHGAVAVFARGDGVPGVG